MRISNLFFVLCLLGCDVQANNPGLERIQKFYEVDLPRRITKEVESKLADLASNLRNRIDGISYNVNALVYRTKDAKNEFTTRKFKNFRKRLEAFEILIQGTIGYIYRMELERDSAIALKNTITKENLCRRARNIALYDIIPVHEYHEIKIDLPPPKLKHQTSMLESEHEAAGKAGAAVFNTAAAGGCAIGAIAGTVFPVLGNIIGCVLGAVGGVGIGAAGGAATTAIMTDSYNEGEISAYNGAFMRTVSLQKAQIAEIDEWLKNHPMSDEMLRARAESICLEKTDWTVFEELANQLDIFKLEANEIIENIKHSLAKEQEELIPLREKAERETEVLANAKAYALHFDAQIKPMLEQMLQCLDSQPCIEGLENKIRTELGMMRDKWLCPENEKHPRILERHQLVAKWL